MSFLLFVKVTAETPKNKEHHKGMLNMGAENYLSLPEPNLEVFPGELNPPGSRAERAGWAWCPDKDRARRGEGQASARRKARREPSSKGGGAVGGRREKAGALMLADRNRASPRISR